MYIPDISAMMTFIHYGLVTAVTFSRVKFIPKKRISLCFSFH